MRRTCLSIAPVAVLALGLAVPPTALAQTGGPYALTWSSIAGGGGALSTAPGSGFALHGTIGQPDAGPLTGGSYTLNGGFWSVDGTFLVDVSDDRPQLPVVFRVHPSVPNPFGDRTTIAFDLPAEDHVRMSVYNVNGERVRTLFDASMPAGRHSITWAGIGDDGRPLTPGIYWVRTQANHHNDVRKLVLVK